MTWEIGVGYRRGCIDDRQANAAAFEMFEARFADRMRRRLAKARFFDARVPPRRNAALRIGIVSEPPAQPPTSLLRPPNGRRASFCEPPFWEAIATTNMKEPSIPDADSSLKDGASSPQR